MTQASRTFRPSRRLLPLAGAMLLLLLGTAPASWAQQKESQPSKPQVKPRTSTPRAGARSTPPRTSRPSTPRATSPRTRSGMSSSKSRSVSPSKPSTRVRPGSDSSTRVRPMTPPDRERPRGYDGPWSESNPPRGVHPPPGASVARESDSGTDRGHGHGYQGHGYHGHGYYGHGYHYYRHYPRYYGSYLHFGLGYYPHYYYHPYAYHYPRSVRVAYEPQGALDLNIKPKDTQVFVNGYYVGTTGDFDGWPRYLWLDEDTYELIFYKEGYETVVREIAVRPDLVIDVKLRMQPGASVAPEELTRYGGDGDRHDRDRRYDRDRHDRDRHDRDRRYDRDRDDRDRYDQAPRDRQPYERERREGDRDRDDGAPRAERVPATEEMDVRTDAGRVRLTVSPPEASVYLDGRFVGIGGELSSVREGLLMDPGEHRLQIFHPEHETVERTFTVEAGEEVTVELELGN